MFWQPFDLQSQILVKSYGCYCVLVILRHSMENITPDSKILVELVQTKMPFGKYKGTLISDLPVFYLEWMHSKGFPAGKLGMLLATAFEIKTNGLGSVLDNVKRMLR